MKRNVDVIVGLQHGDEGKGKVINELAANYDVNVRYQGGSNSGHTVYDENGKKVVFNLIPSGMLNKNVIGVITGGCVINPYAFAIEAEKVGESILNLRDRLYISLDTQVTLPTHILIDIFSEKKRAKSGTKIIGSTNRGNTPTYMDKVARRGIRVSDIATSSEEAIKLTRNAMSAHIEYITEVLDGDYEEMMKTELVVGLNFEDYVIEWYKAISRLKRFNLCNTTLLLHRFLAEDKKILIEGAQGTMLDIDFGTYPYCTSSSVTASAAFAQSGIPVQCVGRVFGVFKPYVTRVGQGFFPTEIKEGSRDWITAEHICEVGKEYGSVTGRKRKIGWLDLPQLKYACMVNGVTDLIMMKCDVVNTLPVFFVGESYDSVLEKSTDKTIYSGELDFNGAVVRLIKFGELVPFINDYVSDVITEPKVYAISESATERIKEL